MYILYIQYMCRVVWARSASCSNSSIFPFMCRLFIPTNKYAPSPPALSKSNFSQSPGCKGFFFFTAFFMGTCCRFFCTTPCFVSQMTGPSFELTYRPQFFTHHCKFFLCSFFATCRNASVSCNLLLGLIDFFILD